MMTVHLPIYSQVLRESVNKFATSRSGGSDRWSVTGAWYPLSETFRFRAPWNLKLRPSSHDITNWSRKLTLYFQLPYDNDRSIENNADWFEYDLYINDCCRLIACEKRYGNGRGALQWGGTPPDWNIACNLRMSLNRIIFDWCLSCLFAGTFCSNVPDASRTILFGRLQDV